MRICLSLILLALALTIGILTGPVLAQNGVPTPARVHLGDEAAVTGMASVALVGVGLVFVSLALAGRRVHGPHSGLI